MSRVSFGPFVADLSSGELRKHGVPMKLQEQPAKILTAMLRQPGEVVSRETLINLLWTDGTFVDYDRGLNAAINRLRQALSDSAESPRYIETVAKRGYRFVGAVESVSDTASAADKASPPVVPAPPHARKWTVVALASAALLVIIAAAGWMALRPRATVSSPEPLGHTPLTAYKGSEQHPSFSPDGSQVAFSWDGEAFANSDIYIKTVGAEPPLRLTTNPASDLFPAWSPDGRWIAFVRENAGLVLIAPTGGPERTFAVRLRNSSQISWSPDSRYVAYAGTPASPEQTGVFALNVESGETRRLTTAGASKWHSSPAFSPDGRSLAFTDCVVGTLACGLVVGKLAAGITGMTSERGVTSGPDFIESIAWSPDSQNLIFGRLHIPSTNRRLLKVLLNEGAKPQALNDTSGASFPTFPRTGNRLAYGRLSWDFDLYEVHDGKGTRSGWSSTTQDSNPAVSPDGSKIAFTSIRSGTTEIWLAGEGNTAPVRLTTSRFSGSPRWSPDGKWIVFDRQNDAGSWDVLLMDASGGQVRPVAATDVPEVSPSFSRDGKWIYFSANRGGGNQVYRVPVEGGEPQQVTDNGGWTAFESGTHLYYSKVNENCSPLFRRPLMGGAEEQVLDTVCARGFAVTAEGVYYTPGPTAKGLPVFIYDPATKRSRQIANVDGEFSGSAQLSVSADGKRILVSAVHQTGADLYLVENFR